MVTVSVTALRIGRIYIRLMAMSTTDNMGRDVVMEKRRQKTDDNDTGQKEADERIGGGGRRPSSKDKVLL
jgi:hypothetical protein